MSEPETYVSVIIPTLNAGNEIGALIESLLAQTRPPDEIIIIDSESDDNTLEIARRYCGVSLIEIKRSEFDHGGTRHRALMESKGDYVLFLTQDAIPNGAYYIERLLRPFSDQSVALVSGRQLPKEDARPFERLVREFNYPEASHVRDKRDLERLGIKTFFASDVCSAYRREPYIEVGGFPYPCNTNEDMLIAAKLINSGNSIAYASDAEVLHSHNLTLKEQYRRNKAIGVELAQNAELLDGVSEISEGKNLVLAVSRELICQFRIGELIAFGFDCGARLLGNAVGKSVGLKYAQSGARNG